MFRCFACKTARCVCVGEARDEKKRPLDYCKPQAENMCECFAPYDAPES